MDNEIALPVDYLNNLDLLKYFYDSAREKYFSGIRRLIDVGHRKDIRFTDLIARHSPEIEIVYFDNSGFISKLLTGIKEALDAGKKMYSENLKFTSAPEGEFDAASYFFTIHEFDEQISQRETLQQTHSLLRKKGLVFVIDYNLLWVRGLNNPKQSIRNIFNSKNERDVIESEPDWFEAHTRYSLEKCIEDMNAVGFKRVESHPEPGEKSKLFFYVGKK